MHQWQQQKKVFNTRIYPFQIFHGSIFRINHCHQQNSIHNKEFIFRTNRNDSVLFAILSCWPMSSPYNFKSTAILSTKVEDGQQKKK